MEDLLENNLDNIQQRNLLTKTNSLIEDINDGNAKMRGRYTGYKRGRNVPYHAGSAMTMRL